MEEDELPAGHCEFEVDVVCRDAFGSPGEMKLTVRVLKSPAEFERAEEVQMSAWGMDGRGATPKEAMIAINDNGGLALGAFDGSKMVGFSLAFVGRSLGRAYLYSHMTGVSKEYQSKGVGFMLKSRQRDLSLERGFDLVAWTFDPLISKNSHFNFRKLGVIARNYLVNYYGPMKDSINFGWDTDRFLCEWYVEPKTLQRIRGFELEGTKDAHLAIRKSGAGADSRCADWAIDLRAQKVLVDIPSDVVRLKVKDVEEARRWRQGTREVFQNYFGAGYAAVALLEEGEERRYLLMKARLPLNIFSKHAHARPR
jgi:predicted GNAT superfamily acetyltransferase